MPPLRAALPTVLAAATLLFGATSAAPAATPVLHATASISPSRIHTAHGSVGTPITFQIHTTFSTDPAGAPLFTVQHADIFFPAGFVANGRLFPSCSAKQIERLGKILSRCPKGSKIGSGKVTAVAIQLGVTSQAKIAIFNSNRGKSVTLNIQASTPANINESFDAKLVRVHGAYAYKLTLDVPPSLQQILTGVYVGLERFDISVGATRRVHGRLRGFAEALSCPRSGKAQGHGDVSFYDSTTGQHASASVNAADRCVRA